MNAVPYICLDPHLLSLPQADRSSAEDVEDFVSSVVDWARTADGRCTKAFVCSVVLDAIDDDGAFPWKGELLRLLKHFRVESVDHETVSAAIQSLLKSARIDEAIGLNAVLLDAAKTSLSPTFMRARLRPKTQSAFTDQLAMVVLAQHGVGKTVDHVAVGSAPAGNETPALGYISFATEIAEVDWRAVPTEEEVVCPYTIDEKISVFFSRNGLLEKIEPVSLWPEGNNIEQAKSAIDCCVARLVSYGTSEKARVRYEIGARFLQSAEKWECGQQGRHNFTLIESCARIVLGVPKHEIGEFRDNFTGEQKVRSDGALAYRTHVTKRGAGLRLMFWRRPGGPIEFANVGDKDELVIE